MARAAAWLAGAIALGLVGCSFPASTPASASVQIDADYVAKATAAERIESAIARCKAYPDLPGNQWAAGTAQARCNLLREPTLSLDDIDAMLRRADGVAELDRRMASLLAREKATDHEELSLVYDVFDASDRARDVATAWLAAAPRSPFALAAAGHQEVAAAWALRGDAVARRTPDARFEAMAAMLDRAVPHLQQALALEPRLVPACRALSDAGQLEGRRRTALGQPSFRDLMAEGVAACTRADPASWYVLAERASAAQAKWGGTAGDAHAVVEQARAHLRENPVLGTLLGGDDARTPLALADAGRWADALPGLEAAARIAPAVETLGAAGVAAHKQGEDAKAIVYLSQALRFDPRNRYNLAMRAAARNAVNDYAGARDDARRAIDVSAAWAGAEAHADGFAQSVLAAAEEHLGHRDAAREAYAAAALDPSQRIWALRHGCELDIVPTIDAERAAACTAQLVSEFPDDAQSMFMRAWVLRNAGTPDTALEERFLAAADRNNDREAGMVSELHRLRGD